MDLDLNHEDDFESVLQVNQIQTKMSEMVDEIEEEVEEEVEEIVKS